jgi:hypothetical protein
MKDEEASEDTFSRIDLGLAEFVIENGPEAILAGARCIYMTCDGCGSLCLPCD